MQEIKIKLSYLPGQAIVFNDPARFKIAACGRRWGKTRGALLWLTDKSLERKKSLSWWVAPVYSQSKIAFRYLKSLFPELIKYKNDSELYIEFLNGSVIEFKSGDKPDHLRGIGLDYLVLDECATLKESIWSEILRPTLMDTRGEACFIGTPKGQNFFYFLYQKGLDASEKEYKSFHFTTMDNPQILKQEIEEARKTMNERLFRQEILAEFLENIGGVFRNVRNCIFGQFEEPEEDGEYFMGVDLGKYEDFTVLIVLKRKQDGSAHVVAFDRFNQIAWKIQIQRILNLAEKYKPRIYIDKGQVGDAILEALKMQYNNIEGITFTNALKSDLINNLSKLIEDKKITFPEIPELIEELRIFEYKTLPSGKLKMEAPYGYHDDCVIALALASWGLRQSSSLASINYFDSNFYINEPERLI